jgi:O-antigen/teichoic acid export membrane protein
MMAAAIAFLLTPVVSRLFEPADFGIAALFISMSSIVGNAAPLSYDRSIVVAEDYLRSILLLRLALSVVAFISVLSFLLVLFLYFFPIPVSSAGRLGNWIWLLPMAILLIGLGDIFGSWLTREKEFKTLAYVHVSQVLLITISRLFCGWTFGSSTWALLLSYILGLVGSLALIVRTSIPKLWSYSCEHSIRDLIDIAKENKDFPLYNASAVFVLGLSQNLPVLMLGHFFSPMAAGFYSMANRLTSVPLNTGITAFRKVYLQKAAEIRYQGRPLRNALYKTSIGLALSGVIPFSLLWLFGESVLTIVLGARWAEAGRYVEILSPWLFTVWVIAPSSLMMVVLRKQSMWLIIQLGLLGLRFGVFVAAYAFSATSEWTLRIFTLVSTFYNVGIMVNSFRLVLQADKDLPSQNIPPAG